MIESDSQQPQPAFKIRPATDADLPSIQRTLYEAVTWKSKEGVPPLDIAVQHPEMMMYHEDWGRAGDFGVVAETADGVVGAAYGRTFTEESHGHGYVDPQTPELAIAVWDDHAGQGIGRALMNAFHHAAKDAGFGAVSLSVNRGNFAEKLYRATGYEVLDDDGTSLLMIKRF